MTRGCRWLGGLGLLLWRGSGFLGRFLFFAAGGQDQQDGHQCEEPNRFFHPFLLFGKNVALLHNRTGRNGACAGQPRR
jgi:hypothetical protein